MKTSFLPALVCTAALLIPALRAETLEERDFKLLRAERDRAAAAAMEPVNRHYREGLDKLFKRATQAAELDLAKEIQAELQVVGGAPAATAAGGAPATASAPANGAALTGKEDLRKFIEDSYWVLKTDGSGGYTFLRGGKMIGPFKYWAVEAPDILKTYAHDPKRNPKEPFRVYHLDLTEKTAEFDPKTSSIADGHALRYVGPAQAGKK
jgi:hypothetical protein